MLEVITNRTIFDLPVQTIVNPVNCDGFMGKGLALEVKKRFPNVFIKYQQRCRQGRMKIGKLQLIKGQPQWVLNFPTKDHWRGRSRIEFVEAGLRTFNATYRKNRITSIAFPPLGCGSGGLLWDDVGPLMRRYLEILDNLRVFICLGAGAAGVLG